MTPTVMHRAKPKRETPIDWSVPKRFQGKLVVTRPPGFNEKIIALTFDDGPDPVNTPKILRILEEHDAKATFFVMGMHAHTYPKLLKLIASMSHAIGNHSYTHPAYPTKERAGIELIKTAKAVKKAVGFYPTLYRPTYGITANWLSHIAMDEGYAVVTWTNLSDDTQVKSPQTAINNVLRSPQPGDIVLMHDGYHQVRSTIALPAVLKGLTRLGYRFVTVPELLERYDVYLTAREKRLAARKAAALAKAKQAHERALAAKRKAARVAYGRKLAAGPKKR